MAEHSANTATAPTHHPPARPSAKTRIDSHDLFHGHNEIVIVHQKEEYNLRITRNGKLILTK